MELLFSTLIGALVGSGLRYVLPGRHTYGSLLLPSLGASFTAIIWVTLVYFGWKFDGGWIWTVSIVASALLTLAVALRLPKRRRAEDVRLLDTLSRAS